MQLSGSFLQSVLHRNLSQANQPIGGALASPFSSKSTWLKARVQPRIARVIHLVETVMFAGFAVKWQRIEFQKFWQ